MKFQSKLSVNMCWVESMHGRRGGRNELKCKFFFFLIWGLFVRKHKHLPPMKNVN